jgi:hypothetical protein
MAANLTDEGIHEAEKYGKRDTQLDFGKLISSDNHISKEPYITEEDNERLPATHERRKDEIPKSTLLGCHHVEGSPDSLILQPYPLYPFVR